MAIKERSDMRVTMTLLALSICGAHAQAAVKDQTETGFTVSHKVTIAKPPAEVFKALSAIGQWWEPAHSYSGNAANMTLDAKAGGCFCETWEGGQVEHMSVSFVMPAKILRLKGGLGPLGGNATGVLTFSLADKNGATALSADYAVWGHFPQTPKDLAPAVDGVLGIQIARLKSLVESGQAVTPKADKD